VSLFGTVSAPITTNPPVARWQLGILVGVVSFAGALMAVGVLALLGAVIFRGGAAMRLSGLALVTSDGRPVSPLRALGRSALAWAPLLLLVVIFVAGIAAGDVSVRAVVAPQADASRGVDPRITLSSAHEAGVRAGRAMSGAGRRLRSGLMLWLTPASLVVMLAGAIVAVARPSRGIPDRLAGTWIVPQ
jgi:hypothetical protein